MDVLIVALQVVATLGLGIAIILLPRYLSSYVQKKGKNLATKEDIGDITRRIEEAKLESRERIEALRSELQVSTSSRASFDENQRQALLRFSDTALDLLFGRLTISLGDLPFDDGRSLFEYQQGVMTSLTQLFIDYHKLVLYLDVGTPLADAAQRTLEASIQVRHAFKRNFGAVKLVSLKERYAYREQDKAAFHDAADRTNDAVSRFMEAVDPEQLAMRHALEKYLQALNHELLRSGQPAFPISPE